MADQTRTENDPLGPMPVPANALYGVQTVRAMNNFPISGLRPLPPLVDATVWFKKAAALTIRDTGRLKVRLADTISQSADAIDHVQHSCSYAGGVLSAGCATWDIVS